MALPSLMPNITQFTTALDAAKASIQDAVKAAMNATVSTALAPKPYKCKNGKPVVFCPWSACEGKCTAKNQVCVPNICGSCASVCLNMTLPSFNIAVPSLPASTWEFKAWSAIPKCTGNTVVDIANTFSLAGLMIPSSRCKPCPAGSVATAGLSCVLCPPATALFTNVTTGAASCRLCAKGYASLGFGARSCTACKAGAFAPTAGSLACIPCPPGFTSGPASATCSLKADIDIV